MDKSDIMTNLIVHNSEKSTSNQSIETEKYIYAEQIQRLKYDILNGNAVPLETDLVDSKIIVSWIRSRNYGVDVDQSPSDCPMLPKEDIEKLLSHNQSLIDATIAINKQFESNLHPNYDVFLFDPNGVFLLCIPGENNILSEEIHAAPGMVWNEQTVGTTSMAMVPILKRPSLVYGSAVYLNCFCRTASASAPIFDSNDNLIGIFSLGTTELKFANSLMLSLVTSLASLIQQELLSKVDGTDKDTVAFEREMHEYLFGESTANIVDILGLDNYRYPEDDAYSVYVMKTNDIESEEKWDTITRFSNDFLQQVIVGSFIVSRPHLAAFIVPSLHKEFLVESFVSELERQFQVNAILGRSAPHPLHDLRRGCDEARIAVSYLRLMDRNVKIQSFSDLGVFTPLFAQDLKSVKAFCQNKLNPLLDYDARDESSSLTTLKVLVNSNYNLKETAKQLFIHINTLYYRIDKIEQLLKVDLSSMSTRVDLYVAMHAWTLLNMSELWDCRQFEP